MDYINIYHGFKLEVGNIMDFTEEDPLLFILGPLLQPSQDGLCLAFTAPICS